MATSGQNGVNVSPSWVRLNVGGQTFLTTKTTLTKEKDSFLARLVSDDPDLPTDKDESGAYMIDRDPKYFAPILNYLRHGKLIVDDHVSESGVLEEAEFYAIKSMIPQLKEKLRNTDQGHRRHVYRVLQCQEEELAHTISNISDGWRLKQLLNIGSNYNYGPDEQAEYLCVVSQDVSMNADGATLNDEQFELGPNSKVLALRGGRT